MKLKLAVIFKIYLTTKNICLKKIAKLNLNLKKISHFAGESQNPAPPSVNFSN